MKELGIRNSLCCEAIAKGALWTAEQTALGACEALIATSASGWREGSREWIQDRCRKIC